MEDQAVPHLADLCNLCKLKYCVYPLYISKQYGYFSTEASMSDVF